MNINQKSELQRNARKEVIDTLQLISSKEEQIEYQGEVSVADVITELFSDWESAYLQDQEWFIEIFSDRELQALDQFNTEIKTIMFKLGEPLPPLNEFVETAVWNHLASAANLALSALHNPN